MAIIERTGERPCQQPMHLGHDLVDKDHARSGFAIRLRRC